MASYYVLSTAIGTADGSSWANAYTTLAAALNARLAGDTFYVSNNHAETQGSAITLTSPGIDQNHCTILCVNDSSTPPTALATTATISTTGAFNIVGFGGFTYCYGIAFQAGSAGSQASINMSSATPKWWRFDTCTFKLNNTSANSVILLGNTGTGTLNENIEWINCVANFGAVGHSIRLSGAKFSWMNTVNATTGTVPTTLFDGTTTSHQAAPILVRGVDLSHQSGAGINIIDLSHTTDRKIRFEDCKLGSTIALVKSGALPLGPNLDVLFLNCDSSSTNYKYSRYIGQGLITKDISTYLSGGASDGVTPYSYKIDSSTGVQISFISPLESESFLVWNNSLDSITFIIPITSNATLTNGDVWMEVEYLGSSSNPLGSFVTSRKTDIMASNTNLTTDSTSTWISGGSTNQKMSVTFIPQLKGYYRVKIMSGTTTNFWFNPPLKTVIPAFASALL